MSSSMIKHQAGRATGIVMGCVLLVGGMFLPGQARAEPPAKHPQKAAKNGGVVVELCDGDTSLEVPGLKPGQAMSRDQAQSVSDQLMAEWRKKHPEARWDEALAQNQPAPKPGQAPGPQAAPGQPAKGPLVKGAAGQGQAGAPMKDVDAGKQKGLYGSYTSRDERVWAQETQKFIEEGNAIFHSDKKLGGTIGVSCDMCHPNGANTHPETYPKYQVQLQRVALLRDMINWCIENPVKGKPLADDDPKLRAMEAYIIAQRKGTQLDYGKH